MATAPVRSVRRSAGASRALDAGSARPPSVSPSGIFLPGAVRGVSVAPAHRPAAACAGPRAWTPADRAGDEYDALARIAGHAPRGQRAEFAGARVLCTPRISRIDPHRVRRKRVRLHGDGAQRIDDANARALRRNTDPHSTLLGVAGVREDGGGPAAPGAAQRPLGASGRNGSRRIRAAVRRDARLPSRPSPS